MRLSAILMVLLLVAACEGAQPAQQRSQLTTSKANGRFVTLYWERRQDVRMSEISLQPSSRVAGRFAGELTDTDGLCTVRYQYNDRPKLDSWAAYCDSGRTAYGNFVPLGDDSGSVGWGKDEEGFAVRYALHDVNGDLRPDLLRWVESGGPLP